MGRGCGGGDGHRACLRPCQCPGALSLVEVSRGARSHRPGSRLRRTTMSAPSIGNSHPSLSIGIEEEYQTVDPVTRDLRSHIHAEIVQKGRLLMAERVKPEMHQSVVEIGT